MRSVTVVAPGRVYLVGEHIDYNGFGVLPCAISRFVRVTVTETTGPHVLECVQTDDSVKFTPRTFKSSPEIDMRTKHWTNYVVAIYQGFKHRLPAAINGKCFKVEVSGNIPIAAGVSSSSALVVAVGLALQNLLGLVIDRVALAELCIEFEKLAGTAGGGMDQTCILLACKHHAMAIDFHPRLSARPVRVPGKFIAAHSLVESAKAVDAATKFNRRVLECRIAAKLLGCASLKEAATRWSIDTLMDKINSEIPQIYTLDPAWSTQLDCRMQAAAAAASSEDGLKPRARARHVVTEARRVDAFIEAAAEGDLEEMGRLMDESDRSCQKDYECSCPELVELTDCFRKAGALGARLTGAGWGGFAIALVKDDHVNAVLEFLRVNFYGSR